MPRDRTPPLPPAADLDDFDGDIAAEPDDRDDRTADLDRGDDPSRLTNGSLARVFHEIGDMLEVKGELVYKTVAYHKAADAIAHTPVDVAALYRAGDPPKIPGVGAAISEKIRELVATGRMGFYD